MKRSALGKFLRTRITTQGTTKDGQSQTTYTLTSTAQGISLVYHALQKDLASLVNDSKPETGVLDIYSTSQGERSLNAAHELGIAIFETSPCPKGLERLTLSLYFPIEGVVQGAKDALKFDVNPNSVTVIRPYSYSSHWLLACFPSKPYEPPTPPNNSPPPRNAIKLFPYQRTSVRAKKAA